jgi:hypothetical protein
MAKKKKSPTDINVLAKSIVNQVTGETADELDSVIIQQAIKEGKDPLAVILGQRGGLKGGKARAKKLSKKRRAEIARGAAKARWGKQRKK